MLPTDRPDNPASSFLGKLLRQHERGQSPRFNAVDLSSVGSVGFDDAMRILQHAEKAGAIVLQRKRGMDHVIERCKLADPAQLACLLGRTPAAEKASALATRLAPLLDAAPEWVQGEFEAALGKWQKGERALRLEPDDHDRIEDLLRILIALNTGAGGRDIRTFSVSAGVSSKAFVSHRGAVVDIARRAFGMEGLSADEVLSSLGFSPFYQPLHIKGPIAVHALGLDCSNVVPYIALPPQSAEQISLTKPVRAVLTIENFASFNRHVLEVSQDDVIVVYTGGFPSPPILQALKSILSQVPEASLWHWGDIDVGGIRIFRNIEERLSIIAKPHLMTRDIATQRGKEQPGNVTIRKIAGTDSGARDLAAFLAERCYHLEQEHLDPVPVG